MIYRSGYISKTLQHSKKDRWIRWLWLLSNCLLIGMFSVGMHSFFMIINESFLGRLVPILAQSCFFSVGYTFGLIAAAYSIGYFIWYYPKISFQELKQNRWYLLNKMGYSSLGICFGKLLALFLKLFALYTGGFVVAFLFSLLFRYTIVPGQIQSVYLIGLMEMLGVAFFLMMCSLWVETRRAAAGFAFLYFTGNIMLMSLGYGSLVSDICKMSEVRSLFDSANSVYFLILAGAILLFVLVPFLYTLFVPVQYRTRCRPMPGEFVVDYRSDTMRFDKELSKRAWPKLVTVAASAVLILVLLVGVISNLFMLTTENGARSGSKSCFGAIAYLNRSELPAAIPENSLALFKEMGDTYPVQNEDVVLLQEADVFSVKQVTGVSDGSYLVSADGSTSFAVEADRSDMTGILIRSFDWLGHFIIFSATLMGRALLLLAPIGLLLLLSAIKQRPKKVSSRC